MFEDVGDVFRKVIGRNGSKQSSGSNHKNHGNDAQESSSAMVIAVVNQKGGCGKTTTSINLAAGLAKRGFKVLIVDLDPQSHATLGIGVDVNHIELSVYDVLVKSLDFDDVILQTYLPGLDIAPATTLLSGAQLEIADLLGREGLLRTSLYKMFNTTNRQYDYVIMDCSPSLNLITINGIVASGAILIPIQTHYFSLEGMKELFSTVNIVRERISSHVEILGILPTIFDGRTKMNQQILGKLKEYFHDKLLQAVVRMNIALAEASAQGKCIFDYDPNCNGSKDYWTLVDEVILLTKNRAPGSKEGDKTRVASET